MSRQPRTRYRLNHSTKPKSLTEDELEFGQHVYVYCKEHERPHLTGFCAANNHCKTKLNADSILKAYEECEQKGFKLIKY